MARLFLTAIMTLFATSNFAQSNCDISYQYTLGLCPVVWFFNNVPAEDTAFVDFLWDFGDGTFSEEANPQHLYSSSGIYQVCVTASFNGCTSTFCNQVPVPCIQDNACHAGLQYSEGTLCGSYFFWSSSFSTGSQDHDVEWSFGDGNGAVGTSTTHNYTENGTYPICVTIQTADGCTDTYCETLVVDCFPTPPVCEAYFQYTLGLCPEIQFFGATTTPPPSTNEDWHWSFGDGTEGQGPNPTHSYDQNGEYVVCLTTQTAGGCTATYCETLIIDCIPPPPVCEADFQYTLGLCPEILFFGATTTPPPSNDVGWQWSFGDGTTATGPNPLHTYTENGTYTVCLIVETADGCLADECKQIEITCIEPPSCDPYFEYSAADCPSVQFYDGSDAYPGEVTNWVWEFGDGRTSNEQNPVHVYQVNGLFDVCLTISQQDHCSATYCEEVEVDCVISSSVDQSLADVQVYPNPVFSSVNISFDQSYRNIHMELMDVLGKKLWISLIGSGHQHRIDLEWLPAGVYLLNIRAGEAGSTFKLIKEY